MLQDYRAAEWSFDPFQKVCQRCDAVVGRFGVLADETGTRHVVFWPLQPWGGNDGEFLCHEHARPVRPVWRRLAG